ncbi:hypothetical protein BH09SUM1_BH09SUM1_15030 [soil metagenome]
MGKKTVLGFLLASPFMIAGVVSLAGGSMLTSCDQVYSRFIMSDAEKEYQAQYAIYTYAGQDWFWDSEDRLHDFLGALDPKDYGKARAVSDEMLAKRDDAPLYRLIAFDIAIYQVDGPRVQELLAKYRGDFEKSGNAFLEKAPQHYDWWLKVYADTQSGRNFDPLDTFTIDPPYVSEQQWRDFAAVLPLGATCITLKDPLILSSPYVPNFLSIQKYVKIAGVRSNFALLEGRRDDALVELRNAQRLSNGLMNETRTLISNLIGVAGNGITRRNMALVYLDGCTDAESIESGWPTLDEAYLSLRSIAEARPFWMQYEDDHARLLPQNIRPNYDEAEARQKTVLAQFAILHSATAARHELLSTGNFPVSPGSFGALLRMGPDHDPFTDSDPLRIAPDRPDGWTVYSVGPDQKDDLAAIEYDPTNGTISVGDIMQAVPRERRYPFPAAGEKPPATRDELMARYPRGLPPDPFADTKGASLIATDDKPPIVWSFGPDVDEQRWDFNPVPPGSLPAAGDVVRWMPDGSMAASNVFQELKNKPPAPPQPEPLFPPNPDPFAPAPCNCDEATLVSYDPTNGTISAGNLYSREP